ncbi:uncharacterized protein LOC126746479 isoform X2 [Anthonomus grandis grandis]|uniref:uncharacterized protein LOC126746479 isoform X2 n=1 Tax=Anthonomus grandis grandis TaxID=2921223 RepID=UPI0021666982|nr:uncharacterized protein LOC126746479 isoform X2 [Anthonomus grandis grandis]
MSSDDNDKSTERVLEYYQKYSQNKNLPKYFSGTSVSYLPPIEVDSDDNSKYIPKNRPEIPKITVTEEVKYVEKEIVLVNNSPNASSSESPSEHKKLEWDNGADIGYHSAREYSRKKLFKSASLPIIDKAITDQIIILPKEKPSTIIAHHGSDENIDLIVYSSESSCTKSNPDSKESPISSNTPAETPKSSTSETSSALEPPKSHSDSDVSKFVEFQSSIDYLKKKIGLPGAQSTPNIIELDLGKIGSSGTSLAALLSGKSSSEASSSSGKGTGQLHLKVSDNSIMQKPSDEGSNMTQKTTSTTSNLQSKSTKKTFQTKFVELSISTPINVNCKGPTVCSKDKILQTETVFTPKAVQTDNFTPKSDVKTNKKDQEVQYTLYGEADLASSFEYINISDSDNVKKSSQEEPFCTALISKQCNSSKKSTNISGGLSSTVDSSNISKSSSEDIDKQIEKLQRLLKSKKADHGTKKKLLKLLGDLDTSVDSSASSEFFVPKKDKKLKTKVVFKDADNIISAYKERKSSQASTSETKFQSRSILPSHSESSDSSKAALPKTGESSIKSPCEGPVSSHIVARKAAKNVDRSNGDGVHVSDIDEQVKFKNNQIIQSLTTHCSKAISPPTNATTSSSAGSHSVANLTKKPSDDYLLKFAENERNYQLNWINNEISHLSKLKSILELKSGKSSLMTPDPSQPQTNIYNIIRKDDASKKSSERNYVIQTHIHASKQPINNYRLNGQEFLLSDSKSSPDSDRAVIADIEVSSDEKNTNIKVRTFCSACKRPICICSSSKKTINSKLSSLKSETAGKKESLEENSARKLSRSQELRPCNKCTKPICLCPNNKTSSSSTSDTSFLECISDSENPEYINSLQKAFRDCCCTVKDANCGCDFVKKLLKKFQEQQKTRDNEEAALRQQPVPNTSNMPELQTQTEPLNLARKVQTEHAEAENIAVETNKTSQKDRPLQVAPTQDHQKNQTVEKVQMVHSLSQQTKIQVSIPPVSQEVEQQQTNGREIRDQAVEAREPLRDCKCQISPVRDNRKAQTVEKMRLSEAVAQAHVESTEAAAQVMIPSPVNTDTCLNVEDLKPVESLLAGKLTDQRRFSTSKNDDLQRRHIGVQVLPNSSSSASQSEPGSNQNKLLGTVSSKSTDKSIQFKEAGVQYETIKEPSSRTSSTGITLPTNTTMSESTSSNCARVTCRGCKQKAFLAEVSYIQEGDESIAVCSRCYYEKTRSHSAQRSVSHYCHCWDHWRARMGSMYCRCCRVEASKCPKRPQGLAYTVTLEEKKRHRSSKNGLDIKVQKGWSRKSLKNKENYHKKSGEKRLQKEDDEKDEKEREPKRSKRGQNVLYFRST